MWILHVRLQKQEMENLKGNQTKQNLKSAMVDGISQQLQKTEHITVTFGMGKTEKTRHTKSINPDF